MNRTCAKSGRDRFSAIPAECEELDLVSVFSQFKYANSHLLRPYLSLIFKPFQHHGD